MKYIIDHDYHIHSQISLCSGNPAQTPENLLRFARENGLKEIVLTDHYWDENVPSDLNDFYQIQDYDHIAQALPLPQCEGVDFYFGCETDMDKLMTVGISHRMLDKFAFIIVPTNHLHMMGFTIDPADDSIPGRRDRYVERLDRLLDMDLPFEKLGVAHLTCPLLAPYTWEDHLQVLDAIDDGTFRQLFTKLRDRGAGFELNFEPAKYSAPDLERVLRPYRIAKAVGCKFYLGSDSHSPADSEKTMERFTAMTDLLELEESDKFRFLR